MFSEEPRGEDIASGSSQQKSLYVNRDIVLAGNLKKVENNGKTGGLKEPQLVSNFNGTRHSSA